ncbi:UDP-4-amino-4,6-dideoxy-N-acetyl-beta-L-altrosamine N-acetyltransferase, partial [bacterium]|nr:UDP-4-amino-4,6-dideoxy-N-acetyl-beta-L-altrosamine N-acetyltransferase [bacterium]
MKIKDYTITAISEISDADKLLVLEWRNNENIRKWMYDSTLISQDTHLKFIENLKYDENNKYFLVQENKINIGVIYFNKIDYKQKECYFGLYANPFINIAGVGSILEEVCIKYIFDILKLDKLKLEVLEENIRAINLYKKY